MSKFTTQLRWIVEQEQGEIPYSQTHRYTESTWKKLGLNDYEIWEPEYRETLNAKIIDHFFFREIGFETAAQFAWYIRRTMQEIMPYYNKLYEVQAMMTDPLRDWYRHGKRDESNTANGETYETEGWDGKDVSTKRKTGTETEIFDGCESHNGTDTTIVDDDASSHNRTVYQETPMSLLDNVNSPTIEGMNYATNVTYNDGTTTDDSTTTLTHGHGIDRDDTTTTTFNTTDADTIEYGKNIDRNGTNKKTDVGNSSWDEYGLNSSQAKLLIEWKKAWVNIDLQIIEELETCFMGLW